MIPDRLKGFIHASIGSIWGLELLLFLRAHRDRSWSVRALAHELRASGPVVQRSLSRFQAAGLVQDDDGMVQFRPASAELDDQVRDLGELYASRPVELAEEIYSSDRDTQGFAAAFRFKGTER